MAKNNIGWCDSTWNPVTGCTKISEGCRNCWAEKVAKRLKAMGQKKYRNDFEVTCHPDALDIPLKWRKPRRIFVNSMSDLFHKDVPCKFRADVLNVILKAKQHTFLILTKRPEQMKRSMQGAKPHQMGLDYEYEIPLPNLHLGVSVENQETADERIPLLLQTPAAKRFVSIEPMLGPVGIKQAVHIGLSERQRINNTSYNEEATALHGVICGMESGPGRRLVDLDHVRSLKDDCEAAGIPFMYKQGLDDNGDWVKMPLLDGVRHEEVAE